MKLTSIRTGKNINNSEITRLCQFCVNNDEDYERTTALCRVHVKYIGAAYDTSPCEKAMKKTLH